MKKLLLILIFATNALAIPQLINYQGQLSDSSGSPLDTTIAMTFTIWPTPAGGSPDWTETHAAIDVSDGLFHVLLGSATTLPDSFAANRWLGITIGTDPEMTPREQLVSVAYSYRVGTVDGASGGTVVGDLNVTERLSVGAGHSALGFNASISGGQGNSASGTFAHIGGGEQNTASEYTGVVCGGNNNENSGAGAVIAGGGYNTLTASNSVIGGGINNAMGDQMSVIGGGNGNIVNSLWSVIGGGLNNLSFGHGATVGGGIENVAAGSSSTLGGGSSNRVRGAYAVISGGGGALVDSNSATGTASTIPGGQRNHAAGSLSFAAGYRAKALHHGSFVWGDSTASDLSSIAEDQFVVRASGGTYFYSNPIKTEGVFLPAGSSCWQSVDTSETCNETGVSQVYVDSALAAIDSVNGLYGGQILSDITISGRVNAGSGNTNSGANATVFGLSNTASGSEASVLGGQDNTTTANFSTIAGGQSNTISNPGSFIGGGQNNHARGDYSVISGGGGPAATDSNHTDGSWSCVPGGRSNSAGGTYALAGGRNANANHTAAFVWSDNSSVGTGLSSTVNNQFSVRAAGGTRFFTNSAMTLGAQLTANATAWTVLSDSTRKTDIERVNTKVVLDKVMQLPISEWRYKEQPDASIRHMGPMAQDFWAQFHLGEDSLGISTIDPDGVSLAAIQELAKQNEQKDTKITDLETRVKLLEAAILQFGNLINSDKQ